MPIQSALLFETPEEICARVFRALKPRTPPPEIRVEFRPFANADSLIRMKDGRLEIRISDLLENAPAPVLEALAYILLAKLLRKPVPRACAHRYKLYLNRRDVRRSMHLIRQMRGRKFISGPQGSHYNLEEIFEELNVEHFHGLLARPLLGWSRRPSRTTFGHFDPSHNAIIVSRLLDAAAVPRLAVEYIVYHEMLHLRFPVQARGARQRFHTREFREAERAFPRLMEAKELLQRLA
ncbi:MAG: SprT-like domain-containing protein [Acidobacteriota bacterium]